MPGFAHFRIRLALLVFPAAFLRAQDFDQDIAPILAANCIGCHAGTVKMGSLDLDTHESLMKGGTHGEIVVPGKSAESRLYLMVAGKMSPMMPLSGKSLAAGEIETIRKWIDAGAKPGKSQISKLAVTARPGIKPRAPVKPQISSLAWRPDGKMLALGAFKEVRLADASGKVQATLPGHSEEIRALAFSRDGKFLAAAGGLPGRRGEIKIWDAEKRELLLTISGHADCIYAVVFSPDGKWLASSSYDKLIKLWDVATGKEVRTLKDHIDAIYDLAFTPDGKRLLSAAADRTVKVWDPATGERVFTLGEPADGLNTLALSPDGKHAAAAGNDKSIRVWTLGEKAGTLEHALIASEDAILRLAWSPDGKVIASASADKSLKLFRASDLAEIKTLPVQSDWVMCLQFSPDGRLAAGRFDGSVEIFDAASLASTSFAAR